MARILEAWDEFSLAQKISSCVTLMLVIAAFLYVPYYVPTTASYEYGWIWKPVTYEDPFTKELLDQIDPAELEDELRNDGVIFHPEWRENSMRRHASFSSWGVRRNAVLIVLLGTALHFAVGAVEQMILYKTRDS